MGQVYLSPKTHRDLVEIWAFVAQDSVKAADDTVERIVEAFQRLAQYPGAGRLRPELAPGIRSLPVGRNIVLYRQTSDGVEIAHVVDGARHLPDLFS